MASGLKRAVEILLARSGFASAAGKRLHPSAVVLAYHNVVPRGEAVAGERPVHIDQARFAEHLDALQETHEVVPLDGLAAPPEGGRPRAVVTFDDAYLGTLTAGLEELRARGLPSVVFVPPGLLGAEGFWWDRLAPEGGGPLPEGLRAHALDALGGRQQAVLDWATAEGHRVGALPDHARPATEEQLLEAVAGGGVALASHTWSHPNLARARGAELADELARPRSWLEERGLPWVDWVAYPYGLVDDVAVDAAREASAAGGFLVTGGHCVTRGTPAAPLHRLPRLPIPRDLTVDGLVLRLAGLLE